MIYKKKVLVFIDWFLPGYKAGGPIRSIANLAAHLSNDIEFYIITRDTDYLETSPYPTVKSNQWQEIAPNINVYYFSSEKFYFYKFTFKLVDPFRIARIAFAQSKSPAIHPYLIQSAPP